MLDEATANVDVETDALIQATVRAEFADDTIIAVAHRLHTVIDCDRVLVMDAGQAAEFGPPAELLGYRTDLLHAPARLAIGADTPLSGGALVRNTALENVQITFVAGYGAVATAVPQPIIHAILLTTGFLYEHRGDSDGELPKAAEWLLDPYRMMFVA